jgi:DNA polymerase I-like protein with 3'-5' exonuclease and polymerase domains/uracil-DNA glycosylase
MPFNKRDHFIALEAIMGEFLSGDRPAQFLQGDEREEFCKEAALVRAEHFPKSKAPLPDPELVNTYVLDYPCKQCPMWTTSYAAANSMYFWRSGVYGRGTGKNQIYIVGEALGAFETVAGEPFSGAAGSILSNALEKAGIVEEDCFITNILRCRPEGNRNPTSAEVKACQGVHFQHDLPYGFYDSYGMGEQREEFDPDWRPKLILVLGAQALKHMMKMQKITQNRGVFFDTTFIDTPVKFIATWHPAMILRNPDLIRDFDEDLAKASRFIKGEKIDTVPEITSSLISSKKGYLQWMDFLLGLPADTRLSCDIETTGLNFKTDKMASVAITCTHDSKPYGISFLTCPKLDEPEPLERFNEETEEIELIPQKWEDYPADWCGRHAHLGWYHLDITQSDTTEFQALKAVMESYPLTFQNGDFDVKFFWELGIEASCECDTMDAHLMLNEKPPHNLAYLTKAYIGESAGYKEKFRDDLGDKTAYHEAPAKELLQYNLDDTYYTQILRNIFLPIVHEKGFDDLFYRHAMPLQRTLTRISYRGLRINRGLLMDLAADNRRQIQEKLKILYSEVGEFNVTSHPEVRNLLYNKLKLDILKYTKKGELPSTDKDVLGMLSNVHHVPKLILEVRQLSKQNGTYLDGDDGLPKAAYTGGKEKGLLRFLDENDRVHSHFFPWGTVSGRLSASQPNVLNVPKESVFRNLFIPSDGYVYVDADYSQAELIVLAYLCGDPALIEAVNSSDLHSKVVTDLLGVDPDHPDFDRSRKIAKTINFGKVYGAGPKRLVEQLKFNPGGSIIISLDEAEEYHRKWNAMYPGVEEWGKSIHAEWRRNSELTSIFGRKMRFPDLSQLHNIRGQKDNAEMIEGEKDRLSTNFPPQSAVGDATNRALYMIDEALELRYGKRSPKDCLLGPSPVLSLHDEVILEVPEDMAEETAKMLHEIMLLPLPKLDISLKVDMEIKPSWGEKGTKITF